MKKTERSSEPSLLSNATQVVIDCELQKAMYVAIELIGMLRRFHCDPRQSPQIRADITAVAQWMNFLIEQREYIAIETTAQPPDLVKLSGRLVCEKCRKDAKNKRARSSAQEDSAPLPVWKTQLEFLLACTKRVGVEVFAQDCASYNLRKFPDCLATLMNVLLHQRRYLVPTGAGETKFEVEHGSNCCAECGQTIELASETAP